MTELLLKSHQDSHSISDGQIGGELVSLLALTNHDNFSFIQSQSVFKCLRDFCVKYQARMHWLLTLLYLQFPYKEECVVSCNPYYYITVGTRHSWPPCIHSNKQGIYHTVFNFTFHRAGVSDIVEDWMIHIFFCIYSNYLNISSWKGHRLDLKLDLLRWINNPETSNLIFEVKWKYIS